MNKEQYKRITDLFRETVTKGTEGFEVGSKKDGFYFGLVKANSKSMGADYSYTFLSGDEEIKGTVTQFFDTARLDQVCELIENAAPVQQAPSEADVAPQSKQKIGFV